jgi:hypothetical protein
MEIEHVHTIFDENYSRIIKEIQNTRKLLKNGSYFDDDDFDEYDFPFVAYDTYYGKELFINDISNRINYNVRQNSEMMIKVEQLWTEISNVIQEYKYKEQEHKLEQEELERQQQITENKRRVRRRLEISQEQLNSAKEEVNRMLELKVKKSVKQFMENKIISKIPMEEQEKLWHYYEDNFKQNNEGIKLRIGTKDNPLIIMPPKQPSDINTFLALHIQNDEDIETNDNKATQIIEQYKFTKKLKPIELYLLLIKPNNTADYPYLRRFDNQIEFGSKTLSDWYERYKMIYKEANPEGSKSLSSTVMTPIEDTKDEIKILFPYRSKIKAYEKVNKEYIDISPTTDVKDHRMKDLRRAQRPYFSNYPNSWEIDIAFASDPKYKGFLNQYLFCININTKYLRVYPIKGKNALEITLVITQFLDELPVGNVRGDGEKAFKTVFDNIKPVNPNLKTYFTTSPFTNRNRVVDSVIRNFRNVLSNPYHFADNDKVQQLVKIYNQTPHAAFKNKYTPIQVQNNPDLEGYFIRQWESELRDVMIEQKRLGIKDYKPGNVLEVHIDFGETALKFTKKRRIMNHLATFVEYRNGNVFCKPITMNNKYSRDGIEIPIQFTRKIADNIEQIPSSYKTLFSI